MNNKKTILKVSSAALALSIGFTALSPTSSVFAAENTNAVNSSNSVTINQEEINRSIDEIVNEVLRTAPEVGTNNTNLESRGVVSIGTKLIKKLGSSYVKSTLPKNIYKKFPAELKGKVSEAKWVGVWNTYILMGPLDEVHDVVTRNLDPYVWHWVASTCGYIAQGVVYALI